jgi:tetratricopeptide (TPR) repeat protein
MMLKHDRLRAAAIEYEKGAKASGQEAGGAGAGRDRREGGDAAAHWIFPVKLGRIYLALGEPDRALKALANAQTLYPDLPWPNLIAGQALLAKGDAVAAVDALKASLATNPFDPAVHCSLAEAYAKLPAGAAHPTPDAVAREQKFCHELAEP